MARTALTANATRFRVLFIGASFGRDGRCRCGSPGFRDALIVLRTFPTYADSADHLSVQDDRYTTLQGRRAGQGQRGYAAFPDLVLEILAWATENGCRARLAESHIDAGDLRVVEPEKQQRMTSVINHDDYR